jgi:D-inositol-3-phosphate glycosyltransferase
MTRALLVAHHYPPHIGGLGIVVQKQAQSLVQNGYQVVVLTTKYEQSPQEDGSRTGIEVIRLPCSWILENHFSIPFPLFSPRLVYETWRQVRRANVVHIHDVFYINSWVACALAALARKPILLTQHVALVEHSSRLVMFMQKLVYGTIGRWIFSKARSIVAYNQNVREFLRSEGVPESRILFTANGIDTTQFCPATQDERADIRRRFGLPQDRHLVLFVGRLVEKKGYRILLEARDSTYDLVFVGPGAIPQDGRTARVHWVGPLDQAKTCELYRACDLFAFPAVGEIFTLVMQEAMASGLPVVTTDDQAYRESIVSRCVTLSPRDAGSFREAIARILSNPELLSRLSAESRDAAVRNFDWRKNFLALEAVYSGILRDLSPSERSTV